MLCVTSCSLTLVVPLRLLTEGLQSNRQSLSPMPPTLPQPRPTHPAPRASNPRRPENLRILTERTGGGSKRRKKKRRKMTMTTMRTRTTRLPEITRPLRGAALNPLLRQSGLAPSVRPPLLTTKTI